MFIYAAMGHIHIHMLTHMQTLTHLNCKHLYGNVAVQLFFSLSRKKTVASRPMQIFSVPRFKL